MNMCDIPAGGPSKPHLHCQDWQREVGIPTREKEKKQDHIVQLLCSGFVFSSNAIPHYSVAIFWETSRNLVVHFIPGQ